MLSIIDVYHDNENESCVVDKSRSQTEITWPTWIVSGYKNEQL
jgi:hypothetical protein